MRKQLRRIHLSMLTPIALAGAMCLSGNLTAQAETAPLTSYFQGLRDRGLFQLAEDYALARLRDTGAGTVEQAIVTRELALTLQEHGALEQGHPREELWADARRRLTAFLNAHPRNPRRVELAATLALLEADTAETLSWEASIDPSDTTSRQTAIASLQAAKSAVQRELGQRDPAYRPSESALADGAPTVTEMAQMFEQLRFELAQLNLKLAQRLEIGPDRAAAIIAADQALENLPKAPLQPELAWQIGVLDASVKHLQGDDRRAIAQLEQWQSDPTLSQNVRDQILAVRVRLEADRGALDDAVELLRPRLRTADAIADELRAAAVDVLLQAAKLAAEKNDTALQQQLLEEAQRQNDNTFGRWRRWTDGRLQRAREILNLGPQLAAAVRQAETEWNAGRKQAAAEHYQQAMQIAEESGRTDQAVEYGFLSGSVLLEAQKWSEAANAFAQIRQRHPDHARVAEADLLRCYALGRLAGTTNSSGAQEQYLAALRQHLEDFPASATHADALWMLGLQTEKMQLWDQALTAFRSLPEAHAHHSEAELQILRIEERLLNAMPENAPERQHWEDQALEDSFQIGDRLRLQSAELTLTQCRTLLACALLQMQHRQEAYEDADGALRRVLEQIALERRRADAEGRPLTRDWAELGRTASQLRVVSLAGQQKLGEARELLKSLATNDPAEMLEVLSGLTQLSQGMDSGRVRELGNLQRMVVKEISQGREQLTPEQQTLLDLSTAEALVATENLPEAAEIYEQLIQSEPDNSAWISRLIEIYQQRGTSSDLQRAQFWWTQLERLEKAGTPQWIRIRLEITDLLLQQDQPDEARKLLGVTRTLYPNMGSSALKQRADALWQRIQSSNPSGAR